MLNLVQQIHAGTVKKKKSDVFSDCAFLQKKKKTEKRKTQKKDDNFRNIISDIFRFYY